MDGLHLLGDILTELVAILEQLCLVEDAHLVCRNLDFFVVGEYLPHVLNGDVLRQVQLALRVVDLFELDANISRHILFLSLTKNFKID